ncbi:MAG TPA: hypothetical protein VF838_18920 [Trebonia sp.]
MESLRRAGFDVVALVGRDQQRLPLLAAPGAEAPDWFHGGTCALASALPA